MGKLRKPVYVPQEKWEEMRNDYVFGWINEETGKREYPSMGALSKRYGVPRGTISTRASLDKPTWTTQRDDMRNEALDRIRKRHEQAGIESIEEIYEQNLRFCNSVMKLVLRDFRDGKISPSIGDGMKVMDARTNIYEKLFGVNEEKPGASINIQVDMMSDDDRNTFFDAALRIRAIADRTGDKAQAIAGGTA